MCKYKEGLTFLPNLIFNTPPPFPLPLNTQRMPTRVYKSLRYLLKMPGLSIKTFCIIHKFILASKRRRFVIFLIFLLSTNIIINITVTNITTIITMIFLFCVGNSYTYNHHYTIYNHHYTIIYTI